MKAIRVQRFGGPDVLSYEEIAPPAPRTGQVRMKIEAAGVNYADIYQRLGQYPDPPNACLDFWTLAYQAIDD